MKIIKEGKPKSLTDIKGRCRDCGCTFTFSPREGKYEADQREGSGFYRVKCPQKGCGSEVIVYNK